MKRDTKKQLIAVVVLLMFVGSSIAFALISTFGSTKPKEQFIFDKPLTNSEEAVFLQQNKVVMKFFFLTTCPVCKSMEPVVEELVQEFNGKLIVEMIDARKYRDEATQYNIENVPTFYIKGKTIDIFVGKMEKEELYNRICALYFEQIEECPIS